MTSDNQTLDDLNERAAIGEPVTAEAFLKAKNDQEFSQWAAERDLERSAAEAEARRIGRIAELVGIVANGDAESMTQLLEAYGTLQSAVAALACAVDTYQTSAGEIVAELRSLEPLPDGVTARSLGDTIDLSTPESMWPQPRRMLISLIAEAAWGHVPAHQRSMLTDARGRIDMSTLDPIRDFMAKSTPSAKASKPKATKAKKTAAPPKTPESGEASGQAST